MQKICTKRSGIFRIFFCILTVAFGAFFYQKSVAAVQSEKHDDSRFNQRMRTVTENLTARRNLWWKIVRKNENKERTSRLPDVICIGVRKCGTGMLQEFIRQHPMVRNNSPEVHYYDKDRDKGLKYYKERLPNATSEELILEKTPAYFTSLPHNLPDIIAKDSPGVKIFLILCDPVKRAFSDYVMRTMRGSQRAASKTFEQYVDFYLPRVQNLFSSTTLIDGGADLERILKALKKDECNHSFAHGIYAYFIRRWLGVFDPSRIMVIDGESFLHDPGAVIEQAQDFLKIPKLILKEDFVKHPVSGLYCVRRWWDESNDFRAEFLSAVSPDNWICSNKVKGITRSQNTKYSLSEATSARLKSFFSPYNKLLSSMLGRRFNW